MKFREEAGVVLLLNAEIGLFSSGTDANARIKVDVRTVADGSYVELNRFVHPEDGELLQQVAQEFSTNFCTVGQRVFRVFVGNHDVDGELPNLGFEQVVVHVDGELFAHLVNGVLYQTVDVGAGQNVVRFLMVDFVHHRVDDEERDKGERERDEGHPPSRDAGRTTGQHGGFTSTAQFGSHQNVAPVAEVLDRPARTRPGIFDANLGVFVIVDEGEEGQCLLCDVMFKLHAS